ncbi:unnamed protein product [Oreochromis niloticus]|nr:unnamed protein product [Mustela putorius furo]
MDDIQNFSALGARPRRNVRRPLRYEAYETDFSGLGAGYQEESETGGDTRSSHHPPSDPSDDRSHGHVTPLRAELEDMQRERFLFQQSHDQMRDGLADFQAFHASLLQLLDRAESLQLSPPPRAPAVHLQPPPAEEEVDWPPPSPPVVFKEESVPVADRIDTMMKELQDLKRESMAAQKSAPDLTYRGPHPSIPKLTRCDPGEFARLKMALENLLPPESSELFRYQVLLDHLHLEEAKLIADAYLHSATPFSDTMNALNDRLGQPHQLALRRIAAVMDSPDIHRGDAAAFERFSLHIQSLVAMLKTLGPDGEVKLQCGSHVARLLSKLPSEQRADFCRCMYSHSGQAYTLDDLATWLKYESWCQGYDGLPTPTITKKKPDVRPSRRPVTVLHGAETSPRSLGTTPNKARPQPYCAFGDNRAHHLSQCPEISPGGKPKLKYKVRNAFIATRIDLAEHSYPVESLKRKYRHLRGLPLQSFKKVKPLLLIVSDHPQLITPTEAVRLGPPGGPAAMCTRLGWTLQGPSSLIGSSSLPQQCLFTTAVPPQVSELLKHVEKLWQVDVVPVPEGKVVTRSREDNYAVSLLEQKTVRVEVEDIQRYATPLLRCQNIPEQWPPEPSGTLAEPPGPSELRKETFCGVSTTFDPATSNFSGYDTWTQLLEAAITQLHGAAKGGGTSSAYDYIQAEMHVLREAQQESFPEEYRLLKQGKSISRSSRLLALSPEFHRKNEVIRDVDSRLCHPGPERVFAEIRRTHWILRGREAVRHFQRTCLECRRWRARPTVPKMADLPVARLRLYKPAFYSTGVDCFGPFEVKIGHRVEKRWGIIFKCLTIRAVHLDVLTSIDTDAFLMALRRFIARRGTPAELYSDQGTNFRGGERELQAAFAAMTTDLQKLLAPQKIIFHFNPPAAPYFGGVWEREIRSVKTALYTTVGSQPLQEEVLRTVLVEVEGILNSKPLGYVPSDISDPDPVTPNCFLMGRPDGALPQVAYPKEELLSRQRWKHSLVLADHFSSRFIRLYLLSLQLRPEMAVIPRGRHRRFGGDDRRSSAASRFLARGSHLQGPPQSQRAHQVC